MEEGNRRFLRRKHEHGNGEEEDGRLVLSISGASSSAARPATASSYMLIRHRPQLSLENLPEITGLLTKNPSKFMHLRHLVLEIHMDEDPIKNALIILRLTYLLEACPQLEHLVLD
ncbi:hypothetical protein E2562_007303, partial [Oryza meyeriana var. granulata]